LLGEKSLAGRKKNSAAREKKELDKNHAQIEEKPGIKNNLPLAES